MDADNETPELTSGVDKGSEDSKSSESPRTVPFEQYQSQQRATSKWQKRARDAAQQLASLETEYQGGMARMEERLDALMRAFGESFEDRKPAIEETLVKVSKQREETTTVARQRGELNALLTEAEVEWDDDRLAEVRPLWDAGRRSEAVEKARAALMPAMSETKMSELVEAKVQERLKELGRVDTGGTSTPAPRRGVSRQSLTQVNPARGTKGIAEDFERELDAFYRTK